MSAEDRLPDEAIRQKPRPQVCNADMFDDLRRDSVIEMQREVAMQEMEDNDQHRAEDIARMKREALAMSRGRPQKTMTERCADASRWLRDKEQYIDDALGKGQRQSLRTPSRRGRAR